MVKKMARKTKREEDKYKAFLAINMTEKQKEELEARAREEQMPMAVYARRKLFPLHKDEEEE